MVVHLPRPLGRLKQHRMGNLLVSGHQLTYIPTNFPAAFADGLQTLLPVSQGSFASVESDVLSAKILQAEELHGTSFTLV